MWPETPVLLRLALMHNNSVNSDLCGPLVVDVGGGYPLALHVGTFVYFDLCPAALTHDGHVSDGQAP